MLGPQAGEQREARGPADTHVGAASVAVLVLVDLEGEAGRQQEVGHHNI